MDGPPFDLLVKNTSEVLTLQGEGLGEIGRGAIGVRAGRVAFLGPERELPQDASATEVVDAHGGFVGPGFVDGHTHVVFAGERTHEFELRARGATYLEIAQAGGGILNTMKAVRAASEEELAVGALPRLRRLLHQGVTTAEVKSGYGLTVESELKMLRAIRVLGSMQPISLVPTLLAAHALPPEFRERRAAYVELCKRELLPEVAREGLAKFCDAFCEASAFTIEETRAMLTAAKAHGLIPRLHADQLSPGGGAELAAELGAASADHLEQISEAGISALARGKVHALLVPISTFFLKLRKYAPGRALIDAGVKVALGSNVNPGSAMSESVSLTLALAVLENGLSPAEAYAAFTRGSAEVLRLPDAGRLRLDGPADFIVFGCSSVSHLPYHLGINHARVVVKSGRVVARPAELHAPLCA